MNDLEKFLQQAAERLAQKLNEGQQPRKALPPAPKPQPSPSVRTAERLPPRQDEPEIIEAELVDVERSRLRREQGPNPLSTIDTLPEMAREISQADERMQGHVKEVFDHEVSRLKQGKVAANSTSPNGDINQATNLQRRSFDESPLVKMLRQPETLRAAFLASEIFKRKIT